MITTSAQLLGVQPTSLQHGTQGLRRRKTLRRFKAGTYVVEVRGNGVLILAAEKLILQP